jgi:hypothetical protein
VALTVSKRSQYIEAWIKLQGADSLLQLNDIICNIKVVVIMRVNSASPENGPIISGKAVVSDHLPIYGYTDNYAGTGHPLSILSWNILYCDEHSSPADLAIWKARLPAIVETILGKSADGRGPDLINLQEISLMQKNDIMEALDNDPRTQGKYGSLMNTGSGPNEDSLVTLYDQTKLAPTGFSESVPYVTESPKDGGRERCAFMNQFAFVDDPGHKR